MDLFDGLEVEDAPIIKAPFGYPGGKSRSVKYILPHLPQRDTYIEPFGGSAAILLARQPSKFEVYNDRYGGVVDFYRCIREGARCEALMDRLGLSIHAKEEWFLNKDTWKDIGDPVERAARWYLMTVYSFGQLGRNWGRSISANSILSGKVLNRIPHFPDLHRRLRNVQIENSDYFNILSDYDSPTAVFYLDPPYVDSYSGTYKNEMSHDEHRRLLDKVFSMRGFVAVSGYSNPLYENNPWDDRFEWDVHVSIRSEAFTEGNGKAALKHQDTGRSTAKEILWIKE